MVDVLTRDDEEQLKIIWKKYYAKDFAFPDFFKHYLCAFKITDKQGAIITAGGVRTICEAVFMTDRSHTSATRGRALIKALHFNKHIVLQNGYDELHCTAESGTPWELQLKKHGFLPTNLQWLTLK